MVRFGPVLNLLQNLTNRDFLAQFVLKLCGYKHDVQILTVRLILSEVLLRGLSGSKGAEWGKGG